MNHNADLARIFSGMANIYSYLGTGERFRALAYQKAAKLIGNMSDDIAAHIDKPHHLEKLEGIGESIGEKILEFLDTGKIEKYEELKKQVPFELLDLMDVRGFGPQTVKQLHEKLKLQTRDEVIAALNDESISKLKGFGSKKVENMKRGLKLHKEFEERMNLWDALNLGENILSELKKDSSVKDAELAGSLRRKKETIGDIDIIVTSKPADRNKIISRFVKMKQVKKILAQGDTKASVLIKEFNRQVDVRIVNENEWGSALLYFTGSKEHNVRLRTLAKEKGYKINEYGVFRVKDDKRVAGNTEEEIYKLFGFQFIPPELREDKGELELAAKNKIPKLIELSEIRGDLQMHSRWSDGAETIESLARYVMKKFNYDYIVLTDHSKSSRIAHGLNEKDFVKQWKEIDSVNKKLGRDFVKKGVEVDILANGELDFPDSFLKQFDWVTAAIHAGFSGDNTQRLIRACENSYVNCIGHPSGRLIGKREPYLVDWEKLIKAAAVTETALEINAQPDRLDLNDVLAKAAMKAGVMLSISTDSHALYQFDFIQLGVSVARRAGCTAQQILNTGKWRDIIKRKRH